MFEGKIRPCLKCGSKGTHWLDGGGFYGCSDYDCRSMDGGDRGKPEYASLNIWNITNTPPEELLRIKLRLKVSGLELPR